MSYDELVKKIREGFKTQKYHELFVDFPIKIDEVNPWTYWQGYGIRNPRILLVGQDWGSLDAAKNVVNSIRAIMDASEASSDSMYFNDCSETKYFPTDRNLAILFNELGDYPDILHKKYKDLFFTNLVPGLRKEGGSTGGFDSKWVTQEVKNDFRTLIEILHPKVIICLGKNTFNESCLIYGYDNKKKTKSFNQYLDNNPMPEEIITDSGFVTHMFGVGHPGARGVSNRKGMTSQINDWKNINNWMKKNL